jgi:hypothetical protein
MNMANEKTDAQKKEEEKKKEEAQKNGFGDRIKAGLSRKPNQPTGQRLGKNAAELVTGDNTPDSQMRIYADTAVTVAPVAGKVAGKLIGLLAKKFETQGDREARQARERATNGRKPR